MSKRISEPIDINKYDTEFQMLIRNLFYDDVDLNGSMEDTDELLLILNGPEQYEFEDEMMDFAKKILMPHCMNSYIILMLLALMGCLRESMKKIC